MTTIAKDNFAVDLSGGSSPTKKMKDLEIKPGSASAQADPSSPWKPKSNSDVSPYIHTTDPLKIAEFLIATFDAEITRRVDMEGTVYHMELKIGDSTIMLGPSHDGTSSSNEIHVYVEDVDKTFARARKAGGEVVMEPTKKEDSDKRGAVKDPTGGITWLIGMHVDPSENDGSNGDRKLVSWKPKSNGVVSPYIVTSQLSKLTQYMEAVFGAKILRKFEARSGMQHIELQIGDSVIMMGDQGEKSVPIEISVYVPNIRETLNRALRFGGNILVPPQKMDEPNPTSLAALSDPFGVVTWFLVSLTPVIPWKPCPNNDVSPYLMVKKVQPIIDFLTKAFDAKEIRRDTKDGRVRHAEVQICDSIVMMGEAEEGTANPIDVHVYVPNVDEVFQKAKALGGQVVMEPAKKEDPDRRGGLKDPAGAATWWIGTQVEVKENDGTNGDPKLLSWKPQSNNVVSPYIVSNHPDETIKFAQAVFDATILRKMEKDGKIHHAELKIGDSVVMVGDVGSDKSIPIDIHVYVPDVDYTFERAKKAGGKVNMEVAQMDGDTDRRGGIQEAAGVVTWWIGSQVEVIKPATS